MYGILLTSIEYFVTQDNKDAAQPVWERILEEAGLSDVQYCTHTMYPDSHMRRLAAAHSRVLSIKYPTTDDSMLYFGQCFVKFCKRCGHANILKVAGRHYRDFLHGIDNLHEMMRFVYPHMHSPYFLVQHEDQQGCVLVYRSTRTGFSHYVKGQLQQCAASLYDVDVEVTLLHKEETSKGCCVRYRLDFDNQAFRPDPVEALQLSAASPEHVKPVPGHKLFQLLPFSVVFDQRLVIQRVGPGVVKLLGSRCQPGTLMTSVFTLRRPLVHFKWENILRMQNVAFELEVKIDVMEREREEHQSGQRGTTPTPGQCGTPSPGHCGTPPTSAPPCHSADHSCTGQGQVNSFSRGRCENSASDNTIDGQGSSSGHCTCELSTSNGNTGSSQSTSYALTTNGKCTLSKHVSHRQSTSARHCNYEQSASSGHASPGQGASSGCGHCTSRTGHHDESGNVGSSHRAACGPFSAQAGRLAAAMFCPFSRVDSSLDKNTPEQLPETVESNSFSKQTLDTASEETLDCITKTRSEQFPGIASKQIPENALKHSRDCATKQTYDSSIKQSVSSTSKMAHNEQKQTGSNNSKQSSDIVSNEIYGIASNKSPSSVPKKTSSTPNKSLGSVSKQTSDTSTEHRLPSASRTSPDITSIQISSSASIQSQDLGAIQLQKACSNGLKQTPGSSSHRKSDNVANKVSGGVSKQTYGNAPEQLSSCVIKPSTGYVYDRTPAKTSKKSFYSSPKKTSDMKHRRNASGKPSDSSKGHNASSKTSDSNKGHNASSKTSDSLHGHNVSKLTSDIKQVQQTYDIRSCLKASKHTSDTGPSDHACKKMVDSIAGHDSSKHTSSTSPDHNAPRHRPDVRPGQSQHVQNAKHQQACRPCPVPPSPSAPVCSSRPVPHSHSASDKGPGGEDDHSPNSVSWPQLNASDPTKTKCQGAKTAILQTTAQDRKSHGNGNDFIIDVRPMNGGQTQHITTKGEGEEKDNRRKDDEDEEDEEEEKEGMQKALLKGQMKYIAEWGLVAYFFTPHISGLEELSKVKMYLADLNMYDGSRDVVLKGFHSAPRLAYHMDQERKTSCKIQKNYELLHGELAIRDKFLRSMLPGTVIDKMRKKENTCQVFDMVTILFSNIVGFEQLVKQVTAHAVVQVLNHSLSVFDPIVDKHRLFKVETLGDAQYMVAGGVQGDKEDHTQRTAELALDFLAKAHHVKSPVDKISLTLRIGMHVGNVVSGTIGTIKPQYCLFGDTVNTAARIQSSGLPGRIHMSEPCHQQLEKSDLVTVCRGVISLKGKGDMRSYWLAGRRGEQSTLSNTLLFLRERDEQRSQIIGEKLNSQKSNDVDRGTGGDNL